MLGYHCNYCNLNIEKSEVHPNLAHTEYFGQNFAKNELDRLTLEEEKKQND